MWFKFIPKNRAGVPVRQFDKTQAASRRNHAEYRQFTFQSDLAVIARDLRSVNKILEILAIILHLQHQKITYALSEFSNINVGVRWY
jgi:hypothetical protein